jgi:hypothetical protein
MIYSALNLVRFIASGSIHEPKRTQIWKNRVNKPKISKNSINVYRNISSFTKILFQALKGIKGLRDIGRRHLLVMLIKDVKDAAKNLLDLGGYLLAVTLAKLSVHVV